MRKNFFLLVLLPMLAVVSCGKDDTISPIDTDNDVAVVPEDLVGYWVSTDQSTETCYHGDTYSWTTNYKGLYHRLYLNADGTYAMETNLQPDADNMVSQGRYALVGDTLLLDNDYDCLVSHRTATSMELDWTIRVQGCGNDVTYYEHFVFDKILPE